MDFTQRVVIDTTTLDWVTSPLAGVWRKPLAREEAERGHATSIVRYESGASFSAHDHPLGEEILVLEGTFSDDTGDYPAGTYFRNPEGFRHAPFSREGCLILVKLHQFQHHDAHHVCIDTGAVIWEEIPGGTKVLRLHEFNDESVSLIDLSAGASYSFKGGSELYVLAGEVRDEIGKYSKGTWVRNPHMGEQTISTDSHAQFWIKTGHLL
jgi:anti-sigma factor ChrR (cupin superfamily)